jgi:hypothetical protein
VMAATGSLTAWTAFAQSRMGTAVGKRRQHNPANQHASSGSHLTSTGLWQAAAQVRSGSTFAVRFMATAAFMQLQLQPQSRSEPAPPWPVSLLSPFPVLSFSLQQSLKERQGPFVKDLESCEASSATRARDLRLPAFECHACPSH